MIRFLCLTASCLSAPIALAEPGPATSDRDAFVSAYRCHVVDALEALRGDDKRDPDKRYVVLARRDRRQAYVQCNQDSPGAIICQASTGLAGPRFDEAGTMQLGDDQRRRLEQLGFAWRSDSLNLVLELGDPLPDPVQLAELMLKTMVEGYGMRLGDRLTLIAPMLQDKPVRLDHCPALPKPKPPA
jgi:hypothetical protein